MPILRPLTLLDTHGEFQYFVFITLIYTFNVIFVMQGLQDNTKYQSKGAPFIETLLIA